MKLKLKEEPGEWRKFTLVWCVAIPVLIYLIRPGWIIPVGAMALVLAILAFVAPTLFRGPYRFGMTISFHIGRVMGTVILSLVFFLVVTPMGILLRLLGKDLLETRRTAGKESYWKEARRTGNFEQQF